jgi:uncharacterized protein
MTFIGRTPELEILKREYARPHPSLIALYGRRRVGKSTLILESLRDTQFVYHQASRLTDTDNLALFKRSLETTLGTSPILTGLNDWSGVLAYLETVAQDQARSTTGKSKPTRSARVKSVQAQSTLSVVIDEFPYLCEAQPGLPSLVQAAWDRIRANNTPLNLILCGSSIAFMEELLSERNPLRGRHNLTIDLEPMPYRDVAAWVPKWKPDEQLRLYGLFGGMPYYLAMIDPNKNLETNLLEIVLERGAPLFDEPTQLLRSELSAPQRYASVLRAISEGCHEWGEIIGRVKDFKDGAQLAPYIKKLEGLRLIGITRSLDANDKDRNRRYTLQDPFLEFWFRFVLPNQSALEAGHAREVLQTLIVPLLDDHMGAIFEGICRDFMRLHGQEILGQPARTVGRVWAAEYDLDVAAELLDGSSVYGECKWWKNPVCENVLERLLETSGQAKYGTRTAQTQYVLFSRSGFTPALKAHARKDPQLHLMGPERLLKP